MLDVRQFHSLCGGTKTMMRSAFRSGTQGHYSHPTIHAPHISVKNGHHSTFRCQAVILSCLFGMALMNPFAIRERRRQKRYARKISAEPDSRTAGPQTASASSEAGSTPVSVWQLTKSPGDELLGIKKR